LEFGSWNNTYTSPWMCVFLTNNGATYCANDSRIVNSTFKPTVGTKIGFLLNFHTDEFWMYIDGNPSTLLSTGIRGRTLYPCYSAHYQNDSIKVRSTIQPPQCVAQMVEIANAQWHKIEEQQQKLNNLQNQLQKALQRGNASQEEIANLHQQIISLKQSLDSLKPHK